MLESFRLSFGLLGAKEKLAFGTILAFRVLIQSLDLLALLLLGLVVQLSATSETAGAKVRIYGFEFDGFDSSTVTILSAITALLFLGKSFFAVVLLRITVEFLARVDSSLTAEAAKFVFLRNHEELKAKSREEIQWLLTQSSFLAFSSSLFAGATVITEVALFLMISSLFLFVDWEAATILFIYFLAFVALFQWLVGSQQKKIGRKISEGLVQTGRGVFDLITVFKEAFVAGNRERFLLSIHSSRSIYSRAKGDERFVSSIPRYLVETGLVVGVLGLAAASLFSGNDFDFSSLAIFLGGGIRMMAAIVPLQNALTELRISKPQSRPAQDLVLQAQKNKPLEPLDTRTVPDEFFEVSGPQPLMAVLRNVSFHYTDQVNRPILKNISIEFPAGQVTAIIGPSGAGKTTLVDLLLGVLKPQSGFVSIGGIGPDRVTRAFPGIMSYVPQRPGLVSGSLAENIALGQEPSEIDLQKLKVCLRKSGLESWARQLPRGVLTLLDDSSKRLSGGQLQRIGIARALYSGARLIVFDEATSGLDPASEREIVETIHQIKSDSTIIMIAHRPETVRRAEKLVVLSDGNVIGEGTFSYVAQNVPLVDKFIFSSFQEKPRHID